MSHIHIDIENLTFAYGKDQPVYEDFSLHLMEGDSVGLVGMNGAGKSTLLRLMVGLLLPEKGSIRVEEIPVDKKTLSKVREKIGYVFQDSDNQLFMPNVYEDVAFAPRNYGLSEEEVTKRVSGALAATHIEHLKDKPIYQLSGGEKKLASIATILSMTPDIIMMDEPSVALDPINRERLIEILNGFDHMKIISSHDLDFIWDTCNRVVLINGGRVIFDGSPDILFRDEKTLRENGLTLPLSLRQR